MSITPKPEPLPDENPTGALALEPSLPGPTDLPGALREVNDVAPDTVTDPGALAALLTGGGDLRTASASMIAAGAPAERVHAAVEATQTYTQAVADLLRAVDSVIAGRTGALIDLALANTHLARIEQAA